jgi:Fe-Mn family superoxide dismutase
MKRTRREVLGIAIGAAVLGPAALGGPLAPPETALVTGQPKPLKLEEVKGFLSKDQLAAHHQTHYSGAVKSLLQIGQELEGADRSRANANWSDVRGLKREEVHAINSVVLHEMYFDGLTETSADPTAPANDALKGRFGSLERWVDDFKAAALSTRGWAVLAWQPMNRKLYNIVSDVHDVGPMVLGVPVVVLDCYEHAFYVDYRSKKGDYVSAFFRFIDWAEVERRIRALK